METQARTTWQGPALPKCLPHPRRSRQTTRVLPRLQQGPRWGGSPTSLCSVSPFEFEPHKGRATRTWQREQVSLQRAATGPRLFLPGYPSRLKQPSLFCASCLPSPTWNCSGATSAPSSDSENIAAHNMLFWQKAMNLSMECLSRGPIQLTHLSGNQNKSLRGVSAQTCISSSFSWFSRCGPPGQGDSGRRRTNTHLPCGFPLRGKKGAPFPCISDPGILVNGLWLWWGQPQSPRLTAFAQSETRPGPDPRRFSPSLVFPPWLVDLAVTREEGGMEGTASLTNVPEGAGTPGCSLEGDTGPTPTPSLGTDVAPRVGFSSGSVGKNLPANAGNARDVGLIPGLGRSPGGGNGNPL